jgi:hypothetical protein
MLNTEHKKPMTPWIVTGVYLLGVYSILPIAPLWVQGLFDLIGYKYSSYLINSILLTLSIAALYRIIRYNRKNGLYALLPLLLSIWFVSQIDKAAERLHLLEYGILGMMVCWAAGYPNGLRLLLALLAVIVAGGVDEMIQYFLPNRYWDIRDIWFNSLGGILGLGLGVLLNKKPSA